MVEEDLGMVVVVEVVEVEVEVVTAIDQQVRHCSSSSSYCFTTCYCQ